MIKANYKWNSYLKSGARDGPNALPKAIGLVQSSTWQVDKVKKADDNEVQRFTLKLR